MNLPTVLTENLIDRIAPGMTWCFETFPMIPVVGEKKQKDEEGNVHFESSV